MAHVSRARRVYERGKALYEDLRRNVIQDVVEKGGDLVTSYFPGNSLEIVLKNRTTYNTVRKIWKQFFETGSTRYESHAPGSKRVFNVVSRASNAAIQRAFRNHLRDGRWTWKRLTQPVVEKFSPENVHSVNNLSIAFIQMNLYKLKVHLTPKNFFRSIESTRYSKHLGAKIFEFA